MVQLECSTLMFIPVSKQVAPTVGSKLRTVLAVPSAQAESVLMAVRRALPADSTLAGRAAPDLL